MSPDVEVLQERISQLESAMKVGDEQWVKLGLSMTEAGIFAALMKQPVLRRDAMQLLMPGAKDDAVTENAETVAIYRMRRKLKRHGIEIGTVWNTGYCLSDENKERAQGLR